MANLRRIASKLQMAHAMRGRPFFLNQYQSYSEKTGRMVTKFVLTEPNARGKRTTVCESWQLADIVTFLADALGGDGECR